ncbi:hypothetical protein ABH940_005124 [Streptacidiphilus sp. BW17]
MSQESHRPRQAVPSDRQRPPEFDMSDSAETLPGPRESV